MAGVFINYRTGDGAEAAVLLDEELKDIFGPENVFRDRRTMQPGVHFPPDLRRHLESCGVLLVLIGPNWLSLRDAAGRRRIDVPGDYVHEEIRCALEWRRTVIPVLIDAAVLPSKDELPSDIAELAERQTMQLRVPYAHVDLPHITEVLRGHVPVAGAAAQPAPPAGGNVIHAERSSISTGSGNAIYTEGRDARSGGTP
ncbi:toll/interleukin-1 receptor domain-containing protein [Streptomyces inhibens]|uniref:Toll/interleukin-1 receptor domain-containing protein n=1 Tax=Streptomyces inhibens TaxID=2293571 RepID=A0A371PXC1_STRIH|nr:toll/interleukin-1 receptor domain-containing protein [Streptomyces inhibens]REK87116.1 toll/interleukin-1 receptor domain-containing protein [Streptomyces inhibens]